MVDFTSYQQKLVIPRKATIKSHRITIFAGEVPRYVENPGSCFPLRAALNPLNPLNPQPPIPLTTPQMISSGSREDHSGLFQVRCQPSDPEIDENSMVVQWGP